MSDHLDARCDGCGHSWTLCDLPVHAVDFETASQDLYWKFPCEECGSSEVYVLTTNEEEGDDVFEPDEMGLLLQETGKIPVVVKGTMTLPEIEWPDGLDGDESE